MSANLSFVATAVLTAAMTLSSLVCAQPTYEASTSHVSSATSTSARQLSQGSVLIEPSVISQKVLGSSAQQPSTQYIKVGIVNQPPLLPSSLYEAQIENVLSSGYPIFTGSGSLQLNVTTRSNLHNLTLKPRMSRDGGRGGRIGNVKLFTFADTATYGTKPGSTVATFTGFVSNSVAVDVGNGPKQGMPPTVQDPIGEWANSEGTMRGWIPFTTGEQAYNDKMFSSGQRIAIWPSSSVIPLNNNTGLQYAPIIFVNNSNNQVSFSTAGTTLLSITVPGRGGPVAKRISPLLFNQGELAWGASAALRSYDSSGIDGGLVYVIAANSQGLFLGRCNASSITHRSSYQYWHQGGTWSAQMPAINSTTDIFLQGPYSSIDMFYSPRHLTFIMVYQTYYAENNFYWRYLQADHPIHPSKAQSSGDWVEAITKYPWSKPQVLITLPKPGNGQYAYAGGAQQGYFDANDITLGGQDLLLTWTSPTGQDDGGPSTGFAYMSAVIRWN